MGVGGDIQAAQLQRITLEKGHRKRRVAVTKIFTSYIIKSDSKRHEPVTLSKVIRLLFPPVMFTVHVIHIYRVIHRPHHLETPVFRVIM